MGAQNLPYKSDIKALVENGQFDLFGFVPPFGPSGGRNVVDKFIIVVTGTITVGTANWDGRDVARIFTNIALFQRDGRPRWQLSGMKSRHASILFNGIQEHQEHAAVVIGAAQAVDWRLIIPMTKKFLPRGKDFALPSDIFHKFTLTVNSLAGMATSATVLSAMALNCYVLAYCHEEHNVEFKSEDQIRSVDFTSNTECRLALNGALQDAFITKEDTTQGGGTSLAAITDVRIEELSTPTLTRQDLAHVYRMKRLLGASGPTTPGTERFLEPVQEGKVVPVLVSDEDTSPMHGRIVPNATLKLGAGLAGLSLITREVLDRSQANYNATVAEFGVDENKIRVKTDGKTRRGLSDGWDRRELAVMPWSAPLARR